MEYWSSKRKGLSKMVFLCYKVEKFFCVTAYYGQILGVLIMKQEKVPVLCGGNNNPFSYDEVLGVAIWIKSFFEELQDIEIYEIDTGYKWVLVCINNDVTLREMFVENFKSSKSDAPDAQKRYVAIELIGNRRSVVKPSAIVPYVDILVLPSVWRKNILRLSEQYSSAATYGETSNYFEKLALQDPVEVL
jgi:hypothetical protein